MSLTNNITKQTHRKRFLKIEMKVKKKREEDFHKFADEVLSQQREYNDLQLQIIFFVTSYIRSYCVRKFFIKLQ